MSSKQERGAVAVEFALLVPILIMMLLGIMEFGRAYNAQASLTNAAREGVRSMAINKDQDIAEAAAKNAASHLDPAILDFDFSPADGCPAATQVTLTINYNLSTITGIAGPFTMTGTGTMLCGG